MSDDDKIPVFKKWSHWYILVVVWLVVLIILFALFTKAFS